MTVRPIQARASIRVMIQKEGAAPADGRDV
jgi:hypothetical protein